MQERSRHRARVRNGVEIVSEKRLRTSPKYDPCLCRPVLPSEAEEEEEEEEGGGSVGGYSTQAIPYKQRGRQDGGRLLRKKTHTEAPKIPTPKVVNE